MENIEKIKEQIADFIDEKISTTTKSIYINIYDEDKNKTRKLQIVPKRDPKIRADKTHKIEY